MSTRIPAVSAPMRKQPRQARSRTTVDAIVQAGARILGQRGWAGFTTNAVAEAAGVSIGSLYQYFPDKHALIDAIRRQHLDDCLSAVQKPTTGKSLRRYVEALVDDMIAVHAGNPGLHQVLLDEVLAAEGLRDPHSAFEKTYLGCHASAVAHYRGQATAAAADALAGTLVSDALDGVIHNAIRRGELASTAVRSELVRLLLLYLRDVARRRAPA
ncbi:TetR/AcrR family transcriptional regulator [Hydrogenophaga sp. ANAO-22]|jgi:AcrR family transcriptional regulator|uniref:TetR/AcrR family transcriptional regulator n=1 Tax=Hydrogenophaga sp. ANAO-22 TaxID=3166645 RepID=UPI0036D3126D